MRGIHRSPVNSPHKGQWRGALRFSFICTWINGWVNNREAGDFRHHRAHYDVILMWYIHVLTIPCTESWGFTRIINREVFFHVRNTHASCIQVVIGYFHRTRSLPWTQPVQDIRDVYVTTQVAVITTSTAPQPHAPIKCRLHHNCHAGSAWCEKILVVTILSQVLNAMVVNKRTERCFDIKLQRDIVWVLGMGRVNIKMSSYQYRDAHVKDKTVSRPSYP